MIFQRHKKNCHFIQVEETDPEAMKKPAIAIKNDEPLTVKIINYKEIGDEFLNEFTAFLAKHINGHATHYTGLEK